jgi:hypothetical protein
MTLPDLLTAACFETSTVVDDDIIVTAIPLRRS